MIGELPAYQQDIRWFCGELQRRGLGKPADGECSAFAERVAIKLDGKNEPVMIARTETFEEYLKARP